MNGSDNGHVQSYNKNKMIICENDGNFKGWGYRHQQCLLLFFAFTIAYSMRACMGVSLVAMTAGYESNVKVANESPHSHLVNDTQRQTGLHLNASTGSQGGNVTYHVDGLLNALLLTPPYPKFKWSKKIQDAVLSSFSWGYMVMQIPAGQVAHRFGARYLLSGALFINSLVCLLLPTAAYYGEWVLTAACRVVQGLSQACVLPGMHTFFGKWAPLQERGRLSGLAYGGQALGTVLGLPMTGFIAASPLGWPGIFRFFGVVSGVAGAVLWALMADTPAQHPRISAAERRYIEEGLAQTTTDHSTHLSVPWSRILRSRGMYAIVIAHIGQTWSHLTMYNEVPSYMDKVMGVAIKANGLLSALPYLVMWTMNFFFSWCTDMLIVKKKLNVTNTRKLAQTIGTIPPAVGLILLAYAPKDIYVVESLLVMIMATNIASHFGFQVNHIDMAPNFAGTLMSISNFVSNLCGSLAPLVAGFILTDVTSVYLWRKVFFVNAAFLLITNVGYVVLGTSERADWNEPQEKKKVTQKEQQSEAILVKLLEN